MTLLASAPTWLATILALLFVAAAIEDMWRLEIEDWLSGGVAIAAFVAVAVDGPIVGLWQNLLLFGFVLGGGILLFARGAMGGGDIKLLAASALWFDLSQGWKMLVAVAIAGGLETLAIMAFRLAPWPAAARSRVALLRRGEEN
ncbi:MAG: A24 family peptidase, partial [Sphingomicrobium sp.]